MVMNFNVSVFRYEVMTRCWNLNPDFRPPFENLRKRMDTYLREEVCSDEPINNQANNTIQFIQYNLFPLDLVT